MLEIYKIISVGEGAELLKRDRSTIRKAIRKSLVENVDFRISRGTMLVAVSALAKIYPELLEGEVEYVK